MYLVVIQSVVTALMGSRLRWHSMERSGTADPFLLDEPLQTGTSQSAPGDATPRRFDPRTTEGARP
jgi:hypothetical protein